MNAACALAAAILAAPAAAPPEAPDGTIRGVVLGGDGRPVPGAALAVLRSVERSFDVLYAPFPDGTVRSDSRGRFVLRTAPGHLAVVASRVDAGTVTLRLAPVVLAAAGTAQVVVRFDGSASIRGRALDEAGRPAAKVRVTAIPERTDPAAAHGDAIIVRTWTASDGGFLLAGLAPGAHRLLARGAGLACAEPCEYGNGMRVRTGPSPVNVPLAPTGSISGRVVLRDGQGRLHPVPAFQVSSRAFGTVRLGPEAEGRFEVDVARLWSGAALFVEAPPLAPYATRFDLPSPVALDLGDLVLGPGRTVRGRVRDESGAAVQGALVRVGFAKGALDEPSATTDAAGAFEIAEVPEGPTPLAVTHPRFQPREAVAAAGASEVEVRLEAGISLAVRVEDLDGTPVAGARVWSVISQSECFTGADGWCSLSGLQRREQVLEARLLGAARPQARQLRVPLAAAAPAPVTLRLPRRPSLLRVRVVEADGTFAQAQVWVVVGELPPERSAIFRGQPDLPYYAGGVDLERRFENLPPGRYSVVARAAADPGRCTAQVVALAEGADQAVTVKLPAGPGPCLTVR